MKSCSVLWQSIVICFIYNLPLILSNISIGADQIITSSDTVGIKNISLTNSDENEENLKDKIDIVSSVLEPSVNLELNVDVAKDGLDDNNKQPVSNILTDSSGGSKKILSNYTPAVLTFSESSTVEFQKLVESPLASPSQNEENRTHTPVQDAKIMENITEDAASHPTLNNLSQTETLMAELPTLSITEKNETAEKSEEIPSFSEWAQKRLEEVEKNEQVNSSSKGQGVNGKGSNTKLRSNNYASLDCGAKVIGANPEAVSPGAILSPSSDEYKLNTCTSRIWFVVELCEAIQTKKIDLANYELFSSSPKDFTVAVSDRYPTRDWSVAGKFTAKDERDIQSFDLDTEIFGKYIKVEIKSHYGSEHYCPISLFRAYGTSVFEVLQKEDPAHINRVEDEDDDDDEDDPIASSDKEIEDSQKNLFSSATDAVISIVKRAAEALGNKVNNQTVKAKINDTMEFSPSSDLCSTPSYMIHCNNCSDSLFGEVYELISCKAVYIKKLVGIPLIYRALTNSLMCQSFGYMFGMPSNTSCKTNSLTDYVMSLFSLKYVGAMCNEVAILENGGLLNISQPFPNATESITNEKIVNLKVQEPHVISKPEPIITKLELPNGTETELPVLNTSDTGSTASNLDAVISQIKPTRALTADTELGQTDADVNISKSPDVVEPLEQNPSVETDPLPAEHLTENIVEGTADIEVSSEGMYVLDDHLEHLISELNVDNVPISSTSSTNTPQAQKESIFLRLSNRIKALERNMSLSSQYLEELSRRYKKQVEEMQNLLEKTISTLREESLKKDLRNKQLEDRLDNLTAIMESLIAERHNWFMTMYWLIFSALFIFGIYFFCRKSSSSAHATTSDLKETVEVLRRKSIDVVTHNTPAKKKRRPSDQALKIVRCATYHNEDEKCKPHQRQRKRKKKQIVRRSNSISHIKDDKYRAYLENESKSSTDWVENSHQGIEDIPFVLDESDHSTLEAYPLANELVKIDSPSYMRSAFSFRLNRGSGQHHENGIDVSDKPSSDESSKRRYSPNSVSDVSSSIIEPIKKEKKGLKRLFKKVF